MAFTPEELEAMRLADEEIEAAFRQTPEEIAESRRRDREAKLSRLDNKERKIAENQRAYREANREKYNAYMRAYAAKRRNRKQQAGSVS